MWANTSTSHTPTDTTYNIILIRPGGTRRLQMEKSEREGGQVHYYKRFRSKRGVLLETNGLLILLHHTNLSQNKYTNELIYIRLLWVREQCEVYFILAYDAVWPVTRVSKLHRTWCLQRQVSMEATASSETSAKLWLQRETAASHKTPAQFYQTTRRHNPEDSNGHSLRCETLKCIEMVTNGRRPYVTWPQAWNKSSCERKPYKRADRNSDA